MIKLNDISRVIRDKRVIPTLASLYVKWYKIKIKFNLFIFKYLLCKFDIMS